MTEGKTPTDARRFFRLSVVLLVLLLGGCANGRLYTDVVRPRMREFKATPVGTKHFAVAQHRLKEPITRINLSVEWDNTEVKKAAAKAGVTKIYYTDTRTQSYVFEIYRRTTIIFYGD